MNDQGGYYSPNLWPYCRHHGPQVTGSSFAAATEASLVVIYGANIDVIPIVFLSR